MATKPALLERSDLQRARELFEGACRISRDYDQALAVALDTYGDHGPSISGAGREHFPTCTKDYLRSLARNVGILSRAAYAARPKRVRLTTMRALARAVAARDGSGFYGPQF